MESIMLVAGGFILACLISLLMLKKANNKNDKPTIEENK